MWPCHFLYAQNVGAHAAPTFLAPFLLKFIQLYPCSPTRWPLHLWVGRPNLSNFWNPFRCHRCPLCCWAIWVGRPKSPPNVGGQKQHHDDPEAWMIDAKGPQGLWDIYISNLIHDPIQDEHAEVDLGQGFNILLVQEQVAYCNCTTNKMIEGVEFLATIKHNQDEVIHWILPIWVGQPNFLGHVWWMCVCFLATTTCTFIPMVAFPYLHLPSPSQLWIRSTFSTQ